MDQKELRGKTKGRSGKAEQKKRRKEKRRRLTLANLHDMFNPRIQLNIRRQSTPHSTTRSSSQAKCEFTLKHEYCCSDYWAVG